MFYLSTEAFDYCTLLIINNKWFNLENIFMQKQTEGVNESIDVEP